MLTMVLDLSAMELSASSRKHVFTAIEKTRSKTEPHVLREQVNPDPLQSYMNVQRIKKG